MSVGMTCRTNMIVPFSTYITITKSISNVQLKKTNVNPIPGATITYKITYSNYGVLSGNNVTIFDKIPNHLTFSHAIARNGYQLDIAIFYTSYSQSSL